MTAVKEYSVITISKDDILNYAKVVKNMNEEDAEKLVSSFTDKEMQDTADTLTDIVFDTIAFTSELEEAIETTLTNRVAGGKNYNLN